MCLLSRGKIFVMPGVERAEKWGKKASSHNQAALAQLPAGLATGLITHLAPLKFTNLVSHGVFFRAVRQTRICWRLPLVAWCISRASTGE
jgi:hypothetical protein